MGDRAPTTEELYAALCTLRDAEDPAHLRLSSSWSVVHRWLERAFPGRTTGGDDARQETLISLLRYVPEMRAESPGQAAAWVRTIHKRKRIDVLRGQIHDPVHQGLRSTKKDEDALKPLERVAAPKKAGWQHPKALTHVLEEVERKVEEHIETTEKNAMKRALRLNQARATLLRVVHEADLDTIRENLAVDEPLSRERVYKWVERGRKVVAAGLSHWVEEASEEDRENIAPIAETLRAMVLSRRADAGKPRHERRKS